MTEAVEAYDAGTDREITTLRRENDDLRGILARRAVIEQAKGALILRYGLDDDAAFALLRRWSQTSNVKVHTVADKLINGVCRGSPRHTGTDQLADWLQQQVHSPAPYRTGDARGSVSLRNRD